MLSGGARVDYDSYDGLEPSARVALSYSVTENTFLYASLSRAAHIQPAAIRFLDTPMFGGLIRTQGARSVEASSLLAYELGYRGRVGGRVEHSAAVFYHDYSGLPVTQPRLGPPGLLRLEYDNGPDPTTYGFEWEGRIRATERLVLLGNYTFERLNDDAALPIQVTADLFSVPEHKFMVGAQYAATQDVRLSTYLYYVDDVYAPNPSLPFLPKKADAYFRWDIRAEHELWKDSAFVAVGVQNLVDSDHSEGASAYLNGAEVPRMFYIEFRAAIK
jgi:iron complex outermembrane receptor protein